MSQTPTELENRIKKNLKKLKGWALREKFEAYRIYDGDLPNYPFAVDLYGSYALIHDRRRSQDMFGEEDKLESLKRILSLELQPKDIVVKVRKPQRVGGNKSRQYERQNETGHGLWVQEGKARFLVNLYDYLDTGLFLDHRRLRSLMYKEIQPSESFLNLFSYTGAASVWAALAGARTRSVDLSNTYIHWAKANFKGNRLNPDEHEFLVTDVLDWIRGPVDQKFDWIFLDPPTFSNSKSMKTNFEVERDHVELIRQTLRWLKPEGRLVFSCNKRSFKLSDEITRDLAVKDWGRQTLPMDFRDPKTRHAFLIRFSSRNQ